MIKMVQDICIAVGLIDAEIHVAHKDLFSHFSDAEFNELRMGDFKRLNQLPSIGNEGQLQEGTYFCHFWMG